MYDSLTITASPQQSFNETAEEEMVISLKILNSNMFHHTILTSFCIFEVALLSSSWKLSREIVAKDKIILEPEMFTYVILKAKRTVSSKREYCKVPLVSQARRQQPGEAHLDFARRKSEFRVNIFDDTPTRPDNQEGVLVVQWETVVSSNPTTKRYAAGQSHVALERPVGADDALSDREVEAELYDSRPKEVGDLRRLEKQIVYNLSFPVRVEHNFAGSKVCVVPVQLLLHNVTGSLAMVTVNTLGTNR